MKGATSDNIIIPEAQGIHQVPIIAKGVMANGPGAATLFHYRVWDIYFQSGYVLLQLGRKPELV